MMTLDGNWHTISEEAAANLQDFFKQFKEHTGIYVRIDCLTIKTEEGVVDVDYMDNEGVVTVAAPLPGEVGEFEGDGLYFYPSPIIKY